MIDFPPMQRIVVLCLSCLIVACGSKTATQADTPTDDPAIAPTTVAISPTEADSEPKPSDVSSQENPEKSPETSSEAKPSEAKGGDPALLIGKWEPIAYVRPDGVEMGLVDLPQEERADLSWEFGQDGSVKAGSSIGTVEVQDTTFIATNSSTGEARTFRYTVTETNLLVINPAGDVLKLQRTP
jgi:hypothetical protein